MNKQHTQQINEAIERMQSEFNSKFGNHMTISTYSTIEGAIDINSFNCVLPYENEYIVEYYEKLINDITANTFIKEQNLFFAIEFGTGYIN